MRNHAGKMAIALGSLAAAIALGSGVAAAAPAINPGAPGTVELSDGFAPVPPHSCAVFGLGFAWGVAPLANTPALGFFAPGTPVVGVCTDSSVIFGNAG
jgi:hypothetical protein